jgi:mycothiol system anti-sigma-R factor
MLCDDVRRVVYFFLDGSLGREKLLQFESHLRACRDCDDRILFNRKLRAFIRGRLTPEAAPEHFKARLSQSLRTAQAD